MKLIFDECFTRVGANVIGQFLQLYDPPIEAAFLCDELGATGELDENWGPRFTGRGYVVISRDLGRSRQNKAKGAPLPIVLPRCRVTGVFLSGGLGQVSRFEMVRAVVTTLPDILSECPRADPGTRFRIQKDRGQCVLSVWPIKKGEASDYFG